MKYSEFVLKNIGHKIDFDRCYGVQCVDLINQYMTDVLGIKVTYFPPFAKNFWNDRKKSKFLIKNFDFILPTQKIQRGDIGVRNSGTAGHIFIIDKKIGNKLYVYDQNNGGSGAGMTARVFDNTSNYITGILRPKNQKNIDKEHQNVVKSKLKENRKPSFRFSLFFKQKSPFRGYFVNGGQRWI